MYSKRVRMEGGVGWGATIDALGAVSTDEIAHDVPVNGVCVWTVCPYCVVVAIR